MAEPDDPETPDAGKADAGKADAGTADADADADSRHDTARGRRDVLAERAERLPRGSFLRQRDLMMIAVLLVGLICVLALRGACARGAARLVGSFDEPDAGRPKLRKPR